MASLDVTHQAMATPARVEILGRIPGRVPAAVAELLVLPDHRLLALGEAGATVISLPR
jgi:hypothetical protein